MKMSTWRTIGQALVLSLLVAVPAQATPILVSFEASSIVAIAGPIIPAPQVTVSGSILYDAASATSDIGSLLAISLTIDGHVYTVGELAFDSSTNTQGIGGAANGVNGLGAGPDFFITWDQLSLTPGSFFYTASSGITVFSGPLTRFSVTAVPEPATLALVLTGGLGLLRRRSSRRRC